MSSATKIETTETRASSTCESSRFRKAVYLHWIVAVPCQCIQVINGDNDHINDDDDIVVELMDVNKYVKLFVDLSDRELCEFEHIREFLDELRQHTLTHREFIPFLRE